jgi:hypothetical protein
MAELLKENVSITKNGTTVELNDNEEELLKATIREADKTQTPLKALPEFDTFVSDVSVKHKKVQEVKKMLQGFQNNLNKFSNDWNDFFVEGMGVKDMGDKVQVGGLMVNKEFLKKQLFDEENNKTTINTVNKNAYEIRRDILEMSINWTQYKAEKSPNSFALNDDTILTTAKKFYSFVENRRNYD